MKFLFLLLPILSIAQSTVQQQLDKFVSDPAFKYASISFELSDPETGKKVLAYDPDRVLITASTAKLFSTASAVAILGPDFRAETRLYTDGTIDSDGNLIGNLWIRGAGDPSIGSAYFNEKFDRTQTFKNWIDAIQSLGIKTVSGSIIADASEFGYNGVPDGWSWNDMGNYYGAGPSGLTLYDNLISYKFDVPSTVGQKAKLVSTIPEIDELSFTSSITSASGGGDNAYIYGAPYQFERSGRGTLPAGSRNFEVKGSIPDPELLFAQELQRAMEANGISVSSGSTTTRITENTTGKDFYAKLQLVHSEKGAALIDIVKETNFRSINLFAEHMLTLIGHQKGKNGSTYEGLKVLENFWTGKIDINGMRLADGSGLSRSNAVSAHHFTGLLNYMLKSTNGDVFKNSLPISGKSGTLSGLCKGQRADGRIQAKSGSINGVRSYAGYLRGDSGKLYSFALIVNNTTCSSSALKSKMEVLFNSLVSL